MKNISFLFVLITSLISTACAQQGNQKDEIYKIGDYIKGKGYQKYAQATFAGGCFWCTEASFEQIEGVKDVISGYSGGHVEYPTYYAVGAGGTGHAEAIQIYYDPEVISFETLLDIFFVAHDPTTLNRQGPDVGPEYRSAIYYHNEEQKMAIEKSLEKHAAKFSNPIVTEVAAYQEFWVAEAYHQDYYWQHPENPYVQKVSKPKVEKVKKTFADRLKKKQKKT